MMPDIQNRCWFAVRCCCTPNRIFGFMQLPVDGPRQLVQDANGAMHEVQIRKITEPCRNTPQVARVENILMQRPYPMSAELAVFSDDHPIEFWRQIVGFVEVRAQEG